MSARGLGLSLLGALLLLACDPVEPSDAGQYGLQVGLVDRIGSDARRVLVGTSFELAIAQVRVETSLAEGEGLPCVPSTASGSLTKLGATEYMVTQAGPGAVEFGPATDSCLSDAASIPELGVDGWAMRGVEPEAASARWVAMGDHAALFWGMSPGPAAAWPSELGEPLAEARVAADGRFVLVPGLFELGAGPRAEIRWHDPDAAVEVPAHYAELASHVDDDGERQTLDYVDGSLGAGESVASSLSILEHEFSLPPLRAIATEQIANLELVPVYWPSDEPEREWGPPAGVVAITHDAQGRRVVGAPLEWEVTRGRLISTSESYGNDVLELGDCRDEPRKPQWRSATVEATLDDLVAIVELEWVALPGDGSDPSSPLCSASACDCSTSSRPGDAALASLVMLVLGVAIRRPQSKRRRAASSDPK